MLHIWLDERAQMMYITAAAGAEKWCLLMFTILQNSDTIFSTHNWSSSEISIGGMWLECVIHVNDNENRAGKEQYTIMTGNESPLRFAAFWSRRYWICVLPNLLVMATYAILYIFPRSTTQNGCVVLSSVWVQLPLEKSESLFPSTALSASGTT